MPRGRTSLIAKAFQITPADRVILEHMLHQRKLTAGFVRRVQVILAVADGHSLVHVAATLRMSRRNIYKWMERYQQGGVGALEELNGRGRNPRSHGPRTSVC